MPNNVPMLPRPCESSKTRGKSAVLFTFEEDCRANNRDPDTARKVCNGAYRIVVTQPAPGLDGMSAPASLTRMTGTRIARSRAMETRSLTGTHPCHETTTSAIARAAGRRPMQAWRCVVRMADASVRTGRLAPRRAIIRRSAQSSVRADQIEEPALVVVVEVGQVVAEIGEVVAHTDAEVLVEVAV